MYILLFDEHENPYSGIKRKRIFQIEREVVLSNVDKNLKIPILNEYKKKPKSVVPDTPNVQIAWSEQSSNVVRLFGCN